MPEKRTNNRIHSLGRLRGRWAVGKACKWLGFTIIELLVTIAVIAILSAILLSAIGNAKRRAVRTVCLSSFRQLQTAWLVYEGDHNSLPLNNDRPDAGKTPERPSWAAGWLRLDSEPGDKTDSANEELLLGRTTSVWGSLGPYTQTAKIYRCPLDFSTVQLDGSSLRRVRTVSMNCYMNGTGVWQSTNYVTFARLTDIPDPSRMWVFIEEREDSINDGYFALKMDTRYSIVDLPANYHQNGAIISFADGHVEYRRWLEKSTTPPLAPSMHQPNILVATPATDRDMSWLFERTTTRKE